MNSVGITVGIRGAHKPEQKRQIGARTHTHKHIFIHKHMHKGRTHMFQEILNFRDLKLSRIKVPAHFIIRQSEIHSYKDLKLQNLT
jgi:hypothetical protein